MQSLIDSSRKSLAEAELQIAERNKLIRNEIAEKEMCADAINISFSGGEYEYKFSQDIKKCIVEFKRKVTSFINNTIPSVIEGELIKKINLYYKD